MGDLTAEFPADPPERKPDLPKEFDLAAVPDEQLRAMQDDLARMESERATLKTHLDYTIGGSVEQSVHTGIEMTNEANIRSKQSEMEIRALQQRLEKNRERLQNKRGRR